MWPMSRSTSASSFSRKNADEDGGRFVHTLPCECGLRPKRLSGFGTARVGAAPSSVPGLQAQGGRGLSRSRDTASSREREGLLGAENLVDGHSNKTISRLEEDVHTGQRARASGARAGAECRCVARESKCEA